MALIRELVGEHVTGRSADMFADSLADAAAGGYADASVAASGAAADRLAVIGSSLGGFYATALAEQIGCRAVLINPAIWPARDLAHYIGEQQAWHSDERFWFRPEYIAELEALTVPRITRPQRYLLLAATGDEVLDWHEMTARYPGAHQHVIEGSDHGLSDFDDYLDEVVRFCEEQ